MANGIKGEISFSACEQTWTLVYDFNALCTIEEELEVDVESIGGRLASPRMIRSVFRIGLQAKHGDMSDLEAGRLIHDMGAPEAASVIGKAFEAAFPKPDESAEGNGKPATKKAGTSRGR